MKNIKHYLSEPRITIGMNILDYGENILYDHIYFKIENINTVIDISNDIVLAIREYRYEECFSTIKRYNNSITP